MPRIDARVQESLRARIEEISSEIDLQKELLRKLERDKSVAQRQLNSVVDPMAYLPLEISSEIFLQYLDLFSTAEERGARQLLLNICNTWTTIALSSPALWSTIEIQFPGHPRGLPIVLPTWFERAGNRPVSLFLYGDLSILNHPVSTIIWEHCGQLKDLEIVTHSSYQIDKADPTIIDLFDDIALSDDEDDEDMFPGLMPLLRTLEISSLIHERRFQIYEILHLLRRAPNLAECTFHHESQFDADITPETLVLPSLRRLGFGTTTLDTSVDTRILDFLALPRAPKPHPAAARQRSTPPLQELVLGMRENYLAYHSMHEYLLLIPTLSRFDLWWPPQESFLADFFAALVDSDSDPGSPYLLPNLRSLTIRTDFGRSARLNFPLSSRFDITESSWRTLLRAVSARRTKLHALRVFANPPPADVLAAFKELAEDGTVQVYIGVDESEFCAFDESRSSAM
ncbi:hypothetical protein B0H14DRAFT_2679004 [Mycena olivaceomarginata]|nr:hypothetical protein B0H14DRAFT_2679004 [Mycena olivaceomarginata]